MDEKEEEREEVKRWRGWRECYDRAQQSWAVLDGYTGGRLTLQSGHEAWRAL